MFGGLGFGVQGLGFGGWVFGLSSHPHTVRLDDLETLNPKPKTWQGGGDGSFRVEGVGRT